MLSHFYGALAHSRAKGVAYQVLTLLAFRANEQGEVTATVEQLARASRSSRASVQRALRALEALGELEVFHGRGPRGAHVFRVRVPEETEWSPELGVWGYWNEGPQNEAPAEKGGLKTRPEGPQNEAPGASKRGPQEHQNEAPYIRETSKRQEETKETPSPLPPSHEEAEEACRVREALGAELFQELEGVARGRSSPERWRFWLRRVLLPELERLGEKLFRAALRDALAEASSPDVRYPARLIEVRLGQVEPGEKLPAGEAPRSIEELLSPELLDAGGGSELSEAGRRLLEDLGLKTACRHCGSDPVRDDCCVPRAREVLLTFYPMVTRAPSAPVVDVEELKNALSAVLRAGRKILAEEEGPGPRELQEPLAWVRWALSRISTRTVLPEQGGIRSSVR